MKLSSFGKLTAASLVTGVALGFAALPADAQTIQSRILTVDTESNVVEARYRSGRQYRSGRYRSGRHFRSSRSVRGHSSFRHRHVHRRSPSISFGFGFAAPFVAAPYYAPRVYAAPVYTAPVYTGALVPGSAAWIEYCSRKYRSFNPATGLFLSYSGVYRPCRVP